MKLRTIILLVGVTYFLSGCSNEPAPFSKSSIEKINEHFDKHEHNERMHEADSLRDKTLANLTYLKEVYDDAGFDLQSTFANYYKFKFDSSQLQTYRGLGLVGIYNSASIPVRGATIEESIDLLDDFVELDIIDEVSSEDLKVSTLHGALLKAAREDNIEEFEKLVDLGVNVNHVSGAGTALIQAVHYDNIDAVEFLLKNDANPNLQGNTSETAYDVSRVLSKQNTEKIVELLESYGAKKG
mgnify:FL=1